MRALPRRLLAASAATLAAAALLVPAGPVAAAGAASTPDCGPAIYKSDGTAWRCTFADDFTGHALDPSRWTPVTSASTGLTQGGACYVDSPGTIAVGNGVLDLTVRQVPPFACGPGFYTDYAAGQVATYGRFAQQYGRFAIRARFPAATVAGLQSSLWMWPQYSGPAGEIDIAEEFSAYADRAIPYLHYAYDPLTTDLATATNVVTDDWCLVGDVNAFHVYTLTWSPSRLVIAYDGRTCLVDNVEASGPSPFDQPFFLLLTQTLGIGGNAFLPWSTPLPATTQIDWVRVWR